jgi:hypothetical protein
MPLPNILPIDTRTVSGYTADICTAGSAWTVAPVRGRIVAGYSVIHAAITTAANSWTMYINNVAVSNSFTNQNNVGSAAGQVHSCSPSANNLVEQGQAIEFRSDGLGSGVVPAMYFAVIREE